LPFWVFGRTVSDGQAQAQEQSAAGDDQLENVIVTAERRESDEQRTPTR